MTTKEIKDRVDMVVAAVVDERSHADKAKHAPISLPAGSYNLEDLEKIGKASVAGAKAENREEIVAAAVEEANQTFTDRPENGLAPGHKFVTREDEATGAIERIQVFDVEAAEAAEKEAEAKPTHAPTPASAGTTTASAADKE